MQLSACALFGWSRAPIYKVAIDQKKSIDERRFSGKRRGRKAQTSAGTQWLGTTVRMRGSSGGLGRRQNRQRCSHETRVCRIV